MKSIELRLPKDFDKSFVVFKETGRFFPVPWHYHPEYELVLVLKSSGRRMVGDHIGYFKEDDLVFMGSMLPHVWVNDPVYLNGKADHLADAVVIHFKEDFLGKDFFNALEMEPMKRLLHLSKRGMAIQGKTRDKINKIMKKMMPLNGIERLASLMSIFGILSVSDEYELLASPEFANSPDQKESNRLGEVMEYIMRNFDEDISLPKAASMANMGLTTFCNFFKENYRVTFVEYLNLVRVGHACKLLSKNEQTIAEIAYGCGYSTLANFNRQFKKYKGMPPSEYKSKLNIGTVMNTYFSTIYSESRKYEM
ncbi:MAG: AraC family transcriptional regulator [Chitinophagaceae bacterium]|nr:MAG: AraC family transcriptional regulator [Chitinophagaceae bacterium]